MEEKPFIKLAESTVDKRMRFVLVIIIFLSSTISTLAQFQRGNFLVPAVLIGKDTIPSITLQTVEIMGDASSPAAKEAAQKYWRLRYNVYKVYPYARYASAKYKEINDRAVGLSNKERRQFIKEEENKAKTQFEGELRQLSYTQGRILIKLVDRETGKSSYSLVKEMKGTFHAILWQGVARIFSENLKWRYDSLGEDKAIEDVVREIERSAQQPAK